MPERDLNSKAREHGSPRWIGLRLLLLALVCAAVGVGVSFGGAKTPGYVVMVVGIWLGVLGMAIHFIEFVTHHSQGRAKRRRRE